MNTTRNQIEASRLVIVIVTSMVALPMILIIFFGLTTDLVEVRLHYILATFLSILTGLVLLLLTQSKYNPLPEAAYFHGTNGTKYKFEICFLPLAYFLSTVVVANSATTIGLTTTQSIVGWFLVVAALTSLWGQHASSGVLRRVSLPTLREDICTTHLAPGKFLHAMLVHPFLIRMAPLGPIYIYIAVSVVLESGEISFPVAMGILIYFGLFVTSLIYLTWGNLMRSAAPPEEAEDIPGGGILSNFGILILLGVGFLAMARIEIISYQGGGWVPNFFALEGVVHLLILITLLLAFIHRAREATIAAHLGFLLSAERYIGATEYDS